MCCLPLPVVSMTEDQPMKVHQHHVNWRPLLGQILWTAIQCVMWQGNHPNVVTLAIQEWMIYNFNTVATASQAVSHTLFSALYIYLSCLTCLCSIKRSLQPCLWTHKIYTWRCHKMFTMLPKTPQLMQAFWTSAFQCFHCTCEVSAFTELSLF